MFRMMHRTSFLLRLMLLAALLPSALNPGIVMAQGGSNKGAGIYLEQTIAQTERDYYVTGEWIKYSIFIFNPVAPGENVKSKILYFNLFNQYLAPVLTWRTNFSDNVSAGEIKLPDTLSSGIYYLAAYTSFMRNLPLSYIAIKPLYVSGLTDDNFTEFQVREIIAPEEAAGMAAESGSFTTSSEKKSVRGAVAANKEESSIVSLTASKDTISTREVLPVMIRPGTLFPGETVRLSIRMVRKMPFSFSFSENVKMDIADSSAQGTNEINVPWLGEHVPPAYARQTMPCRYLPEEAGYLLSGTVSNPVTGTPLSSKLVTLTVPDSIPYLDYSFTDSSGRFCFVLSPLLDNRSLCLQVLDGDTIRENVQWQTDSKVLQMASGRALTFFWNQDQMKAWDEIRSVGLINLVYGPDTMPDLEKRTSFFKKPFYFTADRKVVPADYSPLENFREVADNLLLSVRYRKKDGSYFIRILEPGRQSFWPPDRRILLNGVFYDDLASIAGKGSKQIRYIEIINRRLLFGDLTFNGLLSLVTNDGEISPSYLARHAYRMENKVYFSESTTGEMYVPDYPLPDFRLGLYWNPDLRLHSGDSVQYVVHASDVPGTYRLEICGFTSLGRKVEEFREIVVLDNGSQHARK
mgnify:CR=1 FL=1